MSSQTKFRLVYGGLYALLFSLFLIFILLDKNERTVTMIMFAIGVSVICSWFGSFLFSKFLKQQLVLNNEIKLEQKKGEELIAESAANYKIYGGKLIVSNIRLCYIRMLFNVEKIIVDIPIASILEVQAIGEKRLDIITLDKTRYSFKLEDAPFFSQKIKKQKS